jgi:hypothetical protein
MRLYGRTGGNEIRAILARVVINVVMRFEHGRS